MTDFYSNASADTVASVVLFVLLAVAVAVGWCDDAREMQEYCDAAEERLQ